MSTKSLFYFLLHVLNQRAKPFSLFVPLSKSFYAKGRTIRKVMGGGGGRGIFSSHDFVFFFRPLLVQEFFLQVKPSARIFFFFQTILLFLSFTN